MYEKIASALRAFLPAYANAVVWVLAGCGWGMLIGSILEAAFGRGADGLLDAAGETSLEAVTGALLAVVAAPVILCSLHLVTLAPLIALMGKFGGRYPHGIVSLGIMHERSARMGAVTSLLCGFINGMGLGPMIGAGVLLESIHGQGGSPVPLLEWSILAGLLAGGILSVVTLGRTLWRSLPETLRERCGSDCGCGAASESFCPGD